MAAVSVRTPELKAYYVKREYTTAMKIADEHVDSDRYTDFGLAEKFYIGPVMNADGVDYYVPMSHQTEKTKNPYSKDPHYMLLKDENGKTFASMDFRHMIPIANPEYLNEMTPKSEYAKKQIAFCQEFSEDICALAKKTYHKINSAKIYDDDKFLSTSATDSRVLVDAMWQFEDIFEKYKSASEAKKQTLNTLEANNQKPNTLGTKMRQLDQAEDLTKFTQLFKKEYEPYQLY